MARRRRTVPEACQVLIVSFPARHLWRHWTSQAEIRSSSLSRRDLPYLARMHALRFDPDQSEPKPARRMGLSANPQSTPPIRNRLLCPLSLTWIKVGALRRIRPTSVTRSTRAVAGASSRAVACAPPFDGGAHRRGQSNGRAIGARHNNYVPIRIAEPALPVVVRQG